MRFRHLRIAFPGLTVAASRRCGEQPAGRACAGHGRDHRPGTRRPTDEQQVAMTLWRTDALDLMPYMASVMFSLRLVDAPGLGTFAVDPGHRLYVDFDAVATDPQRWTPRLCAEALLHECSHLFARHHERGADAGAHHPGDQDDFGVAADLEINDDLVEAGCTRLAEFMIPAKLGLPDHLTAEEYYA